MTDVLYAALAGPTGPSSDLYTVDETTAAMTSVGDIGDPISGMAVDPTDGTIYGTTANFNPTNQSTLVTIDPSTGAETIIGGFDDGSGPGGVAFHELAFRSDGQLFGLCNSSPGLWIIDKTDATCSPADPGGDRIDGGAFDFDSSDVLWLVGGFVNGVAGGAPVIGTLDTSTGLFTQTGSPSDSNYIHSGKFDAADLMWASWQGEARSSMGTDLITVDVSTGTVTEIGTFSVPHVGGLVWAAAASSALRANFTGTPLSGTGPLTVNFTDHSTAGPSGPITAWFWDFGDGNTSTVPSPTHIYTTPGHFTVSLQVTGTGPDGTDTKTRTSYVHVIGPDFSPSLSPSTITVSDGISTLVHLDTTASGGDTETITLSASAPAGFTVTFPANPITAGDVGIPIDVAVGSPAVGTYTITIHAVGTDNSHDVVLTVHVATVVPGIHIAS